MSEITPSSLNEGNAWSDIEDSSAYNLCTQRTFYPIVAQIPRTLLSRAVFDTRNLPRLEGGVGVCCRFLNAVNCFPRETAPGSATDDPDGAMTNREPTDAERERCREHLPVEVGTVEPRVLVTTGNHATQSALAAAGRDLDAFLESVLEPVPCPELGATVLPLVHLSYREVWIGRLGYEYPEYVTAIHDRLDAVPDRDA